MAITIAQAQELSAWCAMGTLLNGWALVVQGQTTVGLERMRQGRADRAPGSYLLEPYWLALLADALAQGGEVAAGLPLLTEALTLARQHGNYWWTAELHRLQGALLLQQDPTQAASAAAGFQQALTVAHQQQARALELRAATSLARLWQQQGKHAEAHALLAPIYGWFTEGFDTTDLQEAKALLEELEA